MLHYILTRTESSRIINQDAEIYFSQVLLFLGNDNSALKNKALSIFNIFLTKLKESNDEEKY